MFQHVSPAKELFGSRTFDLGEGKSGWYVFVVDLYHLDGRIADVSDF